MQHLYGLSFSEEEVLEQVFFFLSKKGAKVSTDPDKTAAVGDPFSAEDLRRLQKLGIGCANDVRLLLDGAAEWTPWDSHRAMRVKNILVVRLHYYRAQQADEEDKQAEVAEPAVDTMADVPLAEPQALSDELPPPQYDPARARHSETAAPSTTLPVAAKNEQIDALLADLEALDVSSAEDGATNQETWQETGAVKPVVGILPQLHLARCRGESADVSQRHHCSVGAAASEAAGVHSSAKVCFILH